MASIIKRVQPVRAVALLLAATMSLANGLSEAPSTESPSAVIGDPAATATAPGPMQRGRSAALVVSAGVRVRINTQLPTTGEYVYFRGKLPTQIRRPVQVQHKRGTRWVRQRSGDGTDRRGRFAFLFTAPCTPGKIRLRIVAPRKKIGSRVYPTLTSKAIRLNVVPNAARPSTPTHGIAKIVGTNGGDLLFPDISTDGRHVAFTSSAHGICTPLDGEPLQHRTRAYVYDQMAGLLTPIPLGPEEGLEASGGGASKPVISGDGRYVAFTYSRYNHNFVGVTRMMIFDSATSTLAVPLTHGTTESNYFTTGAVPSSFSDDGRYLALTSTEPLVAEDTNGLADVYVYEQASGIYHQLSHGMQQGSGYRGPQISGDGRFVTFADSPTHNASAKVYLHDRDTGVTSTVSLGGSDHSLEPTISGDGRYVAYLQVTTPTTAIMVYDRATGETSQVPADTHVHNLAYPDISADGRYITWGSGTRAGTGAIWAYDRELGSLTPVARGKNGTGEDGDGAPRISGDGSFIAFTADTPLLEGDRRNREGSHIYIWGR